MLTLAVGKATPPHALVLFNFGVLSFGSIALAVSKPEEGTLSMFFVLMVLTYVHISIGVYFAPQSFLLIVVVLSLKHPSIFVNG